MIIVAEIGINHNGSLEIAKKLIDTARAAGCDFVKFQKRTPEICVPRDQWSRVLYDTPWNKITYIDYKHKIEFGKREYDKIDRYCRKVGIKWCASAWDIQSLEFLKNYDLEMHKIASPMLTNMELLKAVADTGIKTLVSTGMSTIEEIETAVKVFREKDCPFVLMHCHSAYPMPLEEANLRCILTLKERFACEVGYSGHEPGLQVSLAAVALGVTVIERHITLDRTMWGSDHATSLEPHGLKLLVRDCGLIEKILGDGVKRVYDSELKKRKSLRGY